MKIYHISFIFDADLKLENDILYQDNILIF